ncbi:hypothetical protein [Streptomyces fulvoviolaceus]|nr:hypothetical protein [Streptomyces fulvoviolaceus]MCT9084457.1 hypothetical protein [Streptomyces fulvoviolaceus]
MAHLEAPVMRRAVGWLGRFAGPLLIITISASCGFVLGATAATSSALP